MQNDDPSITLAEGVTETEVIEPLKVLVIGMNQCWGKGETLEEARKFAYNPKHYVAYIVHPDTTVHEVNGAIMYPDNYKPKKIADTLPKKKREIGRVP